MIEIYEELDLDKWWFCMNCFKNENGHELGIKPFLDIYTMRLYVVYFCLNCFEPMYIYEIREGLYNLWLGEKPE